MTPSTSAMIIREEKRIRALTDVDEMIAALDALEIGAGVSSRIILRGKYVENDLESIRALIHNNDRYADFLIKHAHRLFFERYAIDTERVLLILKAFSGHKDAETFCYNLISRSGAFVAIMTADKNFLGLSYPDTLKRTSLGMSLEDTIKYINDLKVNDALTKAEYHRKSVRYLCDFGPLDVLNHINDLPGCVFSIYCHTSVSSDRGTARAFWRKLYQSYSTHVTIDQLVYAISKLGMRKEFNDWLMADLNRLVNIPYRCTNMQGSLFKYIGDLEAVKLLHDVGGNPKPSSRCSNDYGHCIAALKRKLAKEAM